MHCWKLMIGYRADLWSAELSRSLSFVRKWRDFKCLQGNTRRCWVEALQGGRSSGASWFTCLWNVWRVSLFGTVDRYLILGGKCYDELTSEKRSWTSGLWIRIICRCWSQRYLIQSHLQQCPSRQCMLKGQQEGIWRNDFLFSFVF